MRQRGISRDTRRFRHLPEWVLPWSASLGLHLVFLLTFAIWHNPPREVIWADLVDVRLLPASTQENHGQPAPVTAQQPRPVPTGKRLPAGPGASLTAPSALPLADPRSTAAGVAAQEPGPGAPTAAVAVATETAATLATAGITASRHQESATETLEQRYRREQFAYIRVRVMERLIYPPLARRQGWTGQVSVEFTVRDDGSIDGLRVVASSGRSLLDQQALRAVQAAAPFPAPPVSATIALPVVFTLETSRR